MRYDTVIFDLDGTLLDTLDDLTDGVNHALREFGFPRRRAMRYARAWVTVPATSSLSSVPGGRDCPCISGVSTATSPITARTARSRPGHTPAYPSFWRELGRRGVRCAIVSNKPHAATLDLAEKYFYGLVATAVGDQARSSRAQARARHRLGRDARAGRQCRGAQRIRRRLRGRYPDRPKRRNRLCLRGLGLPHAGAAAGLRAARIVSSAAGLLGRSVTHTLIVWRENCPCPTSAG